MRRILQFGILVLFFNGCDDPGTSPTGWLQPYAVWKSHKLHDYTVDQIRNCFCPEGGQAMRVAVSANNVISVTRLSDSLQLPPQAIGGYLTVDSMFVIIRNHGSDSIRVEYNAQYGYPERLEINPQFQPFDGGVTYLLSNLRVGSPPPAGGEGVTITQGVWGVIRFWEGDFMPVTPTGTITPVVREVLVYEATRFDSVGGVILGGFCDTIYTDLVTSVVSDTSGFFQVALPPGKYSFFVREDTLYYANGWDGDGHTQPATVFADSVTERRIDITYRATF